MKRIITIATLSAALLLATPCGDISKYSCVPPQQNPPVLAYNPPSAVYAAETISNPDLKYFTTPHGKKVHLYDFDLDSMVLGILMGNEEKRYGEPKMAGFYITRLLYEYGNRLEFIADAGFYSMSGKDSVGRIIKNGDVYARGSFDGGTYLLYKDGKIEMTPNFNLEQRADYDWVHGGFGRLISNNSIGTSETRTRRGRNLSYWSKRPRIAFALYGEKAGIVLFTGNINQLASVLMWLKVEDACLLDSGSSRFFACKNPDTGILETYRRENQNRAIKSVIYGVRN